MAKIPDVLIVGGGVIGLTTAYYLARAGAAVQIVERGEPGMEASWAGAGIIPPGNPKGAQSAYDLLRATSSNMFAGLSAELLDLTGIDNGYRVCGGIEIFPTGDDEAIRIWQAEGITFSPIEPAQVDALAHLSMEITAPMYALPDMAQVRNPWHLRALRSACEQLKVGIQSGDPVIRWRRHNGRVVAGCTERGRELPADRFLLCAGAWTNQLLEPLGARTSVHPVRGQIVLFRATAEMLRGIVSIDKRYLVARGDGHILAGSTEEPEAGFEKSTTERGVSDLIDFAQCLVPALGPALVEKSWAGLRPGTADGLPYMGQLPDVDNAYISSGHFRAGIQLSPASGRVMADLLLGRELAIRLHDFRVERPPAEPRPSAFRS